MIKKYEFEMDGDKLKHIYIIVENEKIISDKPEEKQIRFKFVPDNEKYINMIENFIKNHLNIKIEIKNEEKNNNT